MKKKLDWIDALKAFAIIGILWNHIVELFGSKPWFSNPLNDWPEFSLRMENLFPDGNNLFVRTMEFLGWLGDMGPGIFIIISGFALTLSALEQGLNKKEFYKKRLIRILPLYITIHLIINLFFILANGISAESLITEQNLLSLLGLRFSEELFFYLNPSWWFVWLIIQFYVIFPFLYKWLLKSPRKFLLITLAITLLSRLAGITNLTYTDDTYLWMTGLFGGTRLFEFTLGMYLAYLFYGKVEWFHKLLSKPNKVFLFSLLIYGTGFICSWTYIGSLISNLLITLGLSGLFYGIFGLIKKSHHLAKGLLYIGKNSFIAFLFHQPFLIYFSIHYDGILLIILLAATIILSFVLSPLLEKIAYMWFKLFLSLFNKAKKIKTGKWTVIFWINLVIAISGGILTYLTENHDQLIMYKFFFFLFILYSCFYYYAKCADQNNNRSSIYALIIVSILIFLSEDYWLFFYSIAICIILFFYIIINNITKRNITIYIASIILIILTISLEYYLKINKPLETDRWGEYPALQKDSVTIYSLIPNKKTHLKYNNYDYTLETNSMGFTSPEINLSIKDSNCIRIFIIGDAFTMPEGVEYHDSYPSHLEKLLIAKFPKKKIEVINGGVTGYGPNEMLLELKKYIVTIRPDIVINQFFVNEFEEINLAAEDRLFDIGFYSKSWFENIAPRQLLNHYELFLRKEFNTPDYEYIYFKSLLYLYNKDSSYYSESVIDKFDVFFKDINELKDKYNFKYYLLYVPSQLEVSEPQFIEYYPVWFDKNDSSEYDLQLPNTIIKKICLKHKIELWETKEFLANNPIQPLYYTESWHWNKDGHKEIANYIYQKLENK